MKRSSYLLCWAVLSTACHGPVINTGPKQASVGGTIAGIVSATDRQTEVVGRKIIAIDVRTNLRYEATTAVDGGYTIKVPEGTYHLEIELHAHESLRSRPNDTHINNSDLDPHRNFVIAIAGTSSRRTSSTVRTAGSALTELH
jgi:hypothetical protein